MDQQQLPGTAVPQHLASSAPRDVSQATEFVVVAAGNGDDPQRAVYDYKTGNFCSTEPVTSKIVCDISDFDFKYNAFWLVYGEPVYGCVGQTVAQLSRYACHMLQQAGAAVLPYGCHQHMIHKYCGRIGISPTHHEA